VAISSDILPIFDPKNNITLGADFLLTILKPQNNRLVFY
jgi:hypothetical protein